jgi:hypothetical protein
MKKLRMAILVVIAGFAMESRASLFDITYSGGGVSGSGEITATANGGGSYTATGGFFTIAPGGSIPANTYSLVTIGSPPTVAAIIGTGGLNLSGDNLITYPGNPFLDGNGLVFDTVLGNMGTVINLWGNGPDNYTLYGAGLGIATGNQQVPLGGDATISLVAVPESTTMIAGALLLLPFGASTLRILRRNHMA